VKFARACRHHLCAGLRGPLVPAPGGDGGRSWNAVPGRALLLRPAAAVVIPRYAASRELPVVRPPCEPQPLRVRHGVPEPSQNVWSPESSTVLQVLVSIQGLVLTAQPSYNEAGYASQVGTPAAVAHPKISQVGTPAAVAHPKIS
jgi:hypothetical protein